MCVILLIDISYYKVFFAKEGSKCVNMCDMWIIFLFKFMGVCFGKKFHYFHVCIGLDVVWWRCLDVQYVLIKILVVVYWYETHTCMHYPFVSCWFDENDEFIWHIYLGIEPCSRAGSGMKMLQSRLIMLLVPGVSVASSTTTRTRYIQGDNLCQIPASFCNRPILSSPFFSFQTIVFKIICVQNFIHDIHV